MSVDGTWRKSSYSGGQGGDCVEVAARPADQLAVRDSRDQAGPVLRFPREAWDVFTAGIKDRRKSALPGRPIGASASTPPTTRLIVVAGQPA